MENKISVIIPAYNVEKYIKRCVDSVLDQSYKNIEIIIVNDGSTDLTGSIIDQYAEEHKNISAVHKANGGVSSARLAGLKKATGDYFCFVDSDDYIEPDMYKTLLENALKYNAQISHCGYKMVFPDGHEDLYYGTGKLRLMNRNEGLAELIKGELIEPSLSNKLYHKSVEVVLDQSPVWDVNIKINEDLLLNYIWFKNASATVFVDVPYYHYMVRKGSAATSKSINRVVDPLKVIERIMNDIDDESNELMPLIYERYLRALITLTSQTEYKKEASAAKKKLQKAIGEDRFKGLEMSRKLKYMSIGAAYITPVYKIVRFVYDTVKGNRKKYDVG